MKKLIFTCMVLSFFVALTISAQESNWETGTGKYAQLMKTENGIIATLWKSKERKEATLICQIIPKSQIEVYNYIPFKTVYFSGKRFQNDDYIEYSSKKDFEIKAQKKSRHRYLPYHYSYLPKIKIILINIKKDCVLSQSF